MVLNWTRSPPMIKMTTAKDPARISVGSFECMEWVNVGFEFGFGNLLGLDCLSSLVVFLERFFY
jgi:hypothetical protein